MKVAFRIPALIHPVPCEHCRATIPAGQPASLSNEPNRPGAFSHEACAEAKERKPK